MLENQKSSQAAQQFAGVFAESLAESLVQAAGIRWRFTVLDNPDLATRQENSVYFKLTLDGGLRGQSFFAIGKPQVAELVSRISGQLESTYNNQQGETLAKLISSAMSRVGASLSSDYGEITSQVDRVDGRAFGEMFVVSLAVNEADRPGLPVMLYFDSELLAGLSSRPAGKNAVEAERFRVDSTNLKLVMDVELNVSLRFGQRLMPLREVLELASGSVIELDRQVDDPVELLLDGKVIARGEAVIVDGNYGLRVTEIPQPISSHLIH
jgi:flagellar motor switch protein FliN/FliY